MLRKYKGAEPLAYFLKHYFAAHKKMGSKDRKQITHLCYCYFRLGKAFTDLSLEQQVLLGLKMSDKDPGPEWNAIIAEYKVSDDVPPGIFPWKDKLSTVIDAAALERSFLIQPDLFLRIRPGGEASVVKKLAEASIAFQKEGDALRLANTVKIDAVLSVNKEVVVQDLSSQEINFFLKRFKSEISNQKSEIRVWDCCAASGGKSILAVDALGTIDLTVSDIRASIIANLKERFREAGIDHYRAFIGDVAKQNEQLKNTRFDLVITDVPCTGSGTWSRTPEQLFYFDPKQIAVYTKLQRSILKNSVHHVKQSGYLLYITCSVFKAENEEQVAFLKEQGFEVVEQQVLTGYDKKADTLFGALLRKL
ncbi:MAG: Fmu (Sun) domain protein [Niabella sp.]|nr:Fmu (Sun) domain protein [Niabella sp.]